MTEWGLQYAHKTEAWSDNAIWRRDADRAEKLLDATYGIDVVLDLGCGTGRMLRRLAANSRARFIGVDPNPEALKIAASRVLPNTELYASLDHFENRSITHVLIMHALPQMADAHAALMKVWQVLEPGGKVVVITHNVNYSRLRAPLDKLRRYRTDLTIKRNFTLGSLIQTMRDHGFVMERAGRYGGSVSRLIPFCAPRLFFVGRRPK